MQKNIKKGELFTEDNLTTKRPGTGVSPIHWDKVIGKVSKRNYLKDSLIKSTDFEFVNSKNFVAKSK